MEKHIYDEKNGLSYTLCGDYYLLDLILNEEEPTYGKYGMLRPGSNRAGRSVNETDGRKTGRKRKLKEAGSDEVG